MLKKVLMRLDASSKIGIGHLMRCFALADGFRGKGFQCIFVLGARDKRVSQMIKKRGHQVETIPSGTDSKTDALYLIKFIKKHKPEFVVIDLYLADLRYLKKIKSEAAFLISIDGRMKKDFYSDIIINPNFGVRKIDYRNKVKDGARLLLGHKYFLLRNEFKSILRKKKKIQNKKITILISLGGSDSKNAVLKVLKGMRGFGEDLDLKIILGPAYRSAQDVKKFAVKNFTNFRIYENPANIADLMSFTDIAVSAGGVTSMELAYLGIPSIIMVTARNQAFTANNLGRKKIAVNLGEVANLGAEEIRKNIGLLINDRGLRMKMASRARLLIDGMGVERVMEGIAGFYEKNKD